MLDYYFSSLRSAGVDMEVEKEGAVALLGVRETDASVEAGNKILHAWMQAHNPSVLPALTLIMLLSIWQQLLASASVDKWW
jgi:hypothetical protein